MKILVQWTKATPEDWIELDSSEWDSLIVPFAKAEPRGGENVNSQPGYIYAVNVQGMVSGSADHYHIEHLGVAGCRLTMWADDVEDGDAPWAKVWTFAPLVTDEKTRGGFNTEIEQEDFFGDKYQRFIPPTENVVHGIWVSDELDATHETVRSVRSWREWADGD